VSQVVELRLGDTFQVLLTLEGAGTVVVDPPYGLEFMGKGWDKLWETGAGMAKVGIGERAIPWPTFGAGTPFGGANPSCATCGGRLRGAKKCPCDEPDWYVNGKPVSDGVRHSQSEGGKQMQAIQDWHLNWLRLCYNLLPSGGVAKVFSATRTFHRLAAAMAEAGFVDVGLEAWGYGSGFPKSLDLSKSIDRHLGKSDEREVVGEKGGTYPTQTGTWSMATSLANNTKGERHVEHITRGATPEAKRFGGWGTSLKPAWEPFVVGMRP